MCQLRQSFDNRHLLFLFPLRLFSLACFMFMRYCTNYNKQFPQYRLCCGIIGRRNSRLPRDDFNWNRAYGSATFLSAITARLVVVVIVLTSLINLYLFKNCIEIDDLMSFLVAVLLLFYGSLIICHKRAS